MTAEERAITTNVAPPRVATPVHAAAHASLRARVGGYVVDMVILSAIAMIAAVAALFLLLFATDSAEQDPSDAALVACFAILFAGVPIVWSVLNVALLLARRQTGGQYVAALRLAREDSGPPSARTMIAWWFCGNPLLFSWPMAVIVGLPLLGAAGLAATDAALAVPLFVMGLCVILPIVALTSALFDARNRALHDRVAGTVVVPA